MKRRPVGMVYVKTKIHLKSIYSKGQQAGPLITYKRMIAERLVT
jgi:hypothetical protein